MMKLHRRKSTDQRVKTTLLASAVLVKQSQIRAVPEQRDWQVRAWEYFDAVGELRFASQWVSNALSRCGLTIRVLTDDQDTPISLDDASDVDERAKIPLDELFGGPTGHPEMLSRLATHLMVAGESYLIGFDSADADGEDRRRWLVASSDEVQRVGQKSLKVRLPENDKQQEIDLSNALVMRIWRPHPRRAWEADSPVRAALPVLKELVDLSAHISATIESRLAGAGLLLLPESATLPAPLPGGAGEPLHEDPAMSTLIDAMVTPITERDSAAAVVPIIVRIPDAATGKAEYMTFSTKLDERILELRNASIRRFSTVVDIPAEVMTGMAEANRWNAWKISEDAVKLHLEPLIALICDCLTTQYLWPALKALGVDNHERYILSYDASNLIQRPNRGPESQNLHADLLVKGRTVRHENGFTEDDAPDKNEIKQTLLIQLAMKGIDPVVVAPYLKELGIELELPEPTEVAVQPLNEELEDPTGVRERGRPPKPERLPTRGGLPDNDDAEERRAVVASLLPPGLDFAAVEFSAMRALELVGKRLLNNSNRAFKGQLRRVDPWSIHTYIPATEPDELLDGAYTLLHQCLPGQATIHQTIDRYVRERLAKQLAHDRDRLMSMLVTAGCFTGGGHRATA